MNVLVVNDDLISQELQVLLVKRSKIANLIMTANNGREALDYLDKLRSRNTINYPRLILLDIDMPEMNGWTFLDKFTEEYISYCKNTRVVITSYTIDRNEFHKATKYPCVIGFQSAGLSVQYLKDLNLEI